MGDLTRVGQPVSTAPGYMEQIRIGATTAGALLIASTAISSNAPSLVANIRTLALLGTSATMAAAATRDALKPDEDAEAREVQRLMQEDAAELIAEAIDVWKNRNIMRFVRGERPSDEWIEAYIRSMHDDEPLALPESTTQAFAPQVYAEPELEMVGGYQESFAPVAVAAPAPKRFSEYGSPAPQTLDPIAQKYGKTIASVTDMHSANSKPRHLALLSVTQCGKTTTLGAISYALRERYPDMRFVALDGKNSEFPEFYEETVYPGFLTDFDPNKVVEFFEFVGEELQRRIKYRLKNEPRFFAVLDEWNGVRDSIMAIKSPGLKGADLVNQIDQILNAIVLRGLEFGVHVCIIGQEVNCSKIGFTDSGRANIHFLALGRSGDKTMIDLLLDSSQVMKSDYERSRLRSEFLKVWQDPNRHPKSPVIVDSRAYSAESLPDFSSLVRLTKKDDLVIEDAPHESDFDAWSEPEEPAPQPTRKMLQLAPATPSGTDTDGLPIVQREVLTHPQFPGSRVVITEPELLELLKKRPDFNLIVKLAISNPEGAVTARSIQQKAHHNNALKTDGVPFNAQQIKLRLGWLAENYPQSFETSADHSTLTIIDPALMELDLK